MDRKYSISEGLASVAAATSTDNRPTFYGVDTTRVLVAVLTPSSSGGIAVSVRSRDPTADADSTCRAAWFGHDSIELVIGLFLPPRGWPNQSSKLKIKLLCDHRICAEYITVETLC